MGRGWWAQSFSCYCSWAGLSSAPPHRLKAGGTPCSVSAVLHGPGHGSHTGLPSRNCRVPTSSIQSKGHPVLGTEEAVNVHGGSRPPHVSFRDSDLPALFLRALASAVSLCAARDLAPALNETPGLRPPLGPCETCETPRLSAGVQPRHRVQQAGRQETLVPLPAQGAGPPGTVPRVTTAQSHLTEALAAGQASPRVEAPR